MQAAPAKSGGMFSGIGSTIAQGMAFGTGSAVAHQAVGAAVGAMSGGGEAPTLPAQAPLVANTNSGQPCAADMAAFQQCLQDNSNQLSDCQFFFDAFNACKSGQSASTSTSTSFGTSF